MVFFTQKKRIGSRIIDSKNLEFSGVEMFAVSFRVGKDEMIAGGFSEGIQLIFQRREFFVAGEKRLMADTTSLCKVRI